ncbi:MAG: insulinase family protein [Cyanobacteria bacterium J083]|nr:MAG: insulinase family protein [Cyanobacteria bacterium J083]
MVSPPDLIHSCKTANLPQIYQLDSGLTIIAQQTPVAAVNLNLWLQVGSYLESDQINGMAHFLEHMVFKGTKKLKPGEFERLIEARGAITNAATSQDYTHYYITTAPQDFPELAPLLLDLVMNPSITESAFAQEKLVVLEEIRRSQDNPSRRIFNRTLESCFCNSPYRRPVLGTQAIIASLTHQQMRDFHNFWYQPSSMTAAVVGNLPAQQLIEIVAEAFTANYCPDKLKIPLVSRPHLPPLDSWQTVVRQVYTDDSLQEARLVMTWRVPGLNCLTQTHCLDILAVILGQGKLSRLCRDLREERRLVTSISASNMTHLWQGLFYVSARLPSANLERVERIIVEHIEQIGQELISAKTINRICTQVANRFIFVNEKPSAIASLYGYYYSQLQTIEPALNYPSFIQAVTAADLQQTALRYLTPNAYSAIAALPG